MTKLISKTKIEVTVGETTVEMTVDEARKLLGELEELFGRKPDVVYIPPAPAAPQTTPYPWWSPYTPYCYIGTGDSDTWIPKFT